MNDLISRQAAIDALDKEYRCTDRSDDWDGLKTAMLIIENLPSAQQTMGQQNDGDTISRRMAINAMANTLWHYPNECYRNLNEYEFAKGLAELGLKSVPSAQPEQAVKGCRNCKYGKYNDHWKTRFCYNPNECTEWNLWEPSAQPDNRLSKIAELVEGTIDHFDLDDAMDLLYQIKEIVGNETSNI